MTIDISTIDQKQFVDIPSSTPEIKIHLSKIGVSNRPLYLKLRDPFKNDTTTTLFGNILISSSLDKNKRGLHMSRIETCLETLKNEGLTLEQFCNSLAAQIKSSQDQSDCCIDLICDYELSTNKNSSGFISSELIKLIQFAEIKGNKTKTKLGVKVPFINACPCTQKWGKRDFYHKLKQKNLAENLILELLEDAPLQAHTNGGIATLEVESNKIEHKTIYKILNNSFPIIRELLKGQDEHQLVKSTHLQGQFCEDNIRTIASNVVAELSGILEEETKIRIHVEVNESVHFHNLWGEINDTLGDIAKGLKA
jgi:GTP cyclohydrolase FolE2